MARHWNAQERPRKHGIKCVFTAAVGIELQLLSANGRTCHHYHPWQTSFNVFIKHFQGCDFLAITGYKMDENSASVYTQSCLLYDYKTAKSHKKISLCLGGGRRISQWEIYTDGDTVGLLAISLIGLFLVWMGVNFSVGFPWLFVVVVFSFKFHSQSQGIAFHLFNWAS